MDSIENKIKTLHLNLVSRVWIRVEGPALEVFKKTHPNLNYRRSAVLVLYRRWIEDPYYEDEVQEVLVFCEGGGPCYQSWWERQPDGHWVEDGPENFF